MCGVRPGIGAVCQWRRATGGVCLRRWSRGSADALRPLPSAALGAWRRRMPGRHAIRDLADECGAAAGLRFGQPGTAPLVSLDLGALQAFPKVSLHDHLDGGLRPETILGLAAAVGHVLPAETADDL